MGTRKNILKKSHHTIYFSRTFTRKPFPALELLLFLVMFLYLEFIFIVFWYFFHVDVFPPFKKIVDSML